MLFLRRCEIILKNFLWNVQNLLFVHIREENGDGRDETMKTMNKRNTLLCVMLFSAVLLSA